MQGQILIINTLASEPIEEFSIKVTDQWKLGDQKKDNGWLILIALQDRAMRLEVGQGLEEYVTDIRSSRIIDEMKIYFRQGQFYAGLMFAIKQIDAHVEGKDFVSEEVPQKAGAKKRFVSLLLFLIIAFISFVFNGLRMGGSGSFRSSSYRSRSGWSSWGGGGSGWGGGGGSWGGGGGGFSGGGSSGKW